MATETQEEGWEKKFDPERALTFAQTCVSEKGDIGLPVYIDAIDQVYRFGAQRMFANLERQGVLSALNGKLTILRELCSGESKEHYSTVQSMVDYEIQHQLVEREDKPSGTVTLIRIHRMMEFLCAGLDKVNDTTVLDSTLSAEIVKAYTLTLGRFHPPLMLTCVQWALLQVLPSRPDLMACIGLDTSAQWMVSFAHGLRRCCDAIQEFYTLRGLSSLSQGCL